MAMEIAVPPQVGGWACGIATVKKGRMAKINERERYISDWEMALAGCRKKTAGLRDMEDALGTFISVRGPLSKVEVVC